MLRRRYRRLSASALVWCRRTRHRRRGHRGVWVGNAFRVAAARFVLISARRWPLTFDDHDRDGASHSNPATLSAVAETAPLRVQLIAKTDFLSPPDVPWTTDANGGSALVEFAGRACYQSWSKPNPRTATNAGYIRHIIDVGHFSVLEHASVSFYITGISRSCTHELIRHRHFSYSQLSQRYVPENNSQIVLPPGVEDDPELREIVTAAADASRATYTELLGKLEAKFADQPNAILRRKQARQAARAVLPNATETRIVVTGNYRAWRHFIAMRASEHADVEIRRLAIACLGQLVGVAPAVFADFEVSTLADGTEVATSPLATEA